MISESVNYQLWHIYRHIAISNLCDVKKIVCIYIYIDLAMCKGFCEHIYSHILSFKLFWFQVQVHGLAYISVLDVDDLLKTSMPNYENIHTENDRKIDRIASGHARRNKTRPVVSAYTNNLNLLRTYSVCVVIFIVHQLKFWQTH